jgi:hypothetical protein
MDKDSMTPQIGEIWQAIIAGHRYLLLEDASLGFKFMPKGDILFKTLRLDTGMVELWVVSDEHFRRVA